MTWMKPKCPELFNLCDYDEHIYVKIFARQQPCRLLLFAFPYFNFENNVIETITLKLLARMSKTYRSIARRVLSFLHNYLKIRQNYFQTCIYLNF